MIKEKFMKLVYMVACIEVECLEDGVTLLYGTLKNRPNGEEPKIKE